MKCRIRYKKVLNRFHKGLVLVIDEVFSLLYPVPAGNDPDSGIKDSVS